MAGRWRTWSRPPTRTSSGGWNPPDARRPSQAADAEGRGQVERQEQAGYAIEEAQGPGHVPGRTAFGIGSLADPGLVDQGSAVPDGPRQAHLQGPGRGGFAPALVGPRK